MRKKIALFLAILAISLASITFSDDQSLDSPIDKPKRGSRVSSGDQLLDLPIDKPKRGSRIPIETPKGSTGTDQSPEKPSIPTPEPKTPADGYLEKATPQNPVPEETPPEPPIIEYYGVPLSIPNKTIAIVMDKSGSMTLACGTHDIGQLSEDLRGDPEAPFSEKVKYNPQSYARLGYVSRWAVAISEFDRLIDSLPEDWKFSAMYYDNVPAEWDPAGFAVLWPDLKEATKENKVRAKQWIRGTDISPLGGTDTLGAMKKAFRLWSDETDDFILTTDGEPTFPWPDPIEQTRKGVPAAAAQGKDRVHTFGIFAARSPVFERLLMDISGATGGTYHPVH